MKKLYLIILFYIISLFSSYAQIYKEKYIKDASEIALHWLNDINQSSYENAYNILAEKVKLTGTIRCTNLQLFREMGDWLDFNISSIARSCGAEAKVKFREIVPPVNNDFYINKVIRESAIGVLGDEKVIELQKPSLGAEDFAEFLNEVPGAMFRLGVSGETSCAPLHSSGFNPDERAIIIGIKVIAESIVKLNK